MKLSPQRYLDARQYLRDAYKRRHRRDRSFNYEELCRLVGLKSPSHITAILKGTRNIPKHLIEPFARAFRLSKKDARYFHWLVEYTQAKTHEKKDTAFQKMLSFHKNNTHVIDPNVYTYFSHWYHPVIRELVAIFPISDENPRLLAHMLEPAISPAAAQRALSLLEKLEIIRKNTHGYYERVDKSITTGEGWRSVTIHNYQRAAADLAKKALERIPKDERDISTLTLSISADSYEKIREKIRTLRRELLAMAEKDTMPQRVYQCNLQLFPVSVQKEHTDERYHV